MFYSGKLILWVCELSKLLNYTQTSSRQAKVDIKKNKGQAKATKHSKNWWHNGHNFVFLRTMLAAIQVLVVLAKIHLFFFLSFFHSLYTFLAKL